MASTAVPLQPTAARTAVDTSTQGGKYTYPPSQPASTAAQTTFRAPNFSTAGLAALANRLALLNQYIANPGSAPGFQQGQQLLEQSLNRAQAQAQNDVARTVAGRGFSGFVGAGNQPSMDVFQNTQQARASGIAGLLAQTLSDLNQQAGQASSDYARAVEARNMALLEQARAEEMSRQANAQRLLEQALAADRLRFGYDELNEQSRQFDVKSRGLSGLSSTARRAPAPPQSSGSRPYARTRMRSRYDPGRMAWITEEVPY